MASRDGRDAIGRTMVAASCGRLRRQRWEGPARNSSGALAHPRRMGGGGARRRVGGCGLDRWSWIEEGGEREGGDKVEKGRGHMVC